MKRSSLPVLADHWSIKRSHKVLYSSCSHKTLIFLSTICIELRNSILKLDQSWILLVTSIFSLLWKRRNLVMKVHNSLGWFRRRSSMEIDPKWQEELKWYIPLIYLKSAHVQYDSKIEFDNWMYIIITRSYDFGRYYQHNTRKSQSERALNCV